MTSEQVTSKKLVAVDGELKPSDIDAPRLVLIRKLNSRGQPVGDFAYVAYWATDGNPAQQDQHAELIAEAVNGWQPLHDEIERLRSLHDAYVVAAAKHAQELERQRDDARIVSDRWAAEAQRLRASHEPPADAATVTRLPVRGSYIAPISDRVDDLVRELQRQGMRTLRATFDGFDVRIDAQGSSQPPAVSPWIKVTHRLPESGVPVLAFVTNELGRTRRIRAQWCAKFTEESDGDDAEYCEEKDTYYSPEGWYESNEYDEVNWFVHDPVSHWMPLPEGPTATKEVKP